MEAFKTKVTRILAVLAAFFITLNLPEHGEFTQSIYNALAVAVLIFGFWVTEALPIPVTSLLPLFLLPFFGITDINQTAANYGNKIIFLFLSGFILALAISKWGLNKRIALNILKLTGTSMSGIIFGFMLATAFLSMWISNTATTVMMLPIALSVLVVLKTQNKDFDLFAKILLISLAYAASIGGIATIIGTPPNAILVSYLDSTLDYEFHFVTWFKLFAPLSIILLIIIWAYLTFFCLKNIDLNTKKERSFIQTEINKLGKMSFEEKSVLIVFLLIAFSWIFKAYFPFEISDVSIGIVGVSLLFIIPAKNKKFLLNWEDTKELSWGTLILFGGGLALAKGLESSGVIMILGEYIQALSQGSLLIALIISIFFAIFLTEFMSNLALTAIFIPILAVISINYTGSPFSLTLPATIAASCAFMLPMSTPPNAIVFSSGHIQIKDMVKAGFVANLLAFATILAYSKIFVS